MESIKETQSIVDYAKQVAKFGESTMKHERNYTWRCIDVCFDDLSAPTQAWLMWNEQKVRDELLLTHKARFKNDKLCLSIQGNKLVREVGFYHEEKVCCISGMSKTHRAKLDALSNLVSLASLGLKKLHLDLSCLPESLCVLETNTVTIDQLVLPHSLKSLAFESTTFGRTSLRRVVEHMKGLIQLSVSHSPSMSEIPTELGRLVCLKRLALVDANLVGKMPSELGMLTKLETLCLEDNRLTGRLPSEIGRLACLIHFSFSNNFVSQSIPSEFGRLIHLQRLDGRRNKLSGSIPTELSKLTNLRSLVLSHNNLCDAQVRLANLETLDLSSNLLRSFPRGVLSPKLVYFNLSYNYIDGEIPTELGLLKKTCQVNIRHNFLNTRNFR